MKKWGLLVSLYYFLALALLLTPMARYLMDPTIWSRRGFLLGMLHSLTDSIGAIPLGIAVGGQILLLGLSVDSSFRRNKPRLHIAAAALLTGFFALVLCVFAMASLAFAVLQEDPAGKFFEEHKVAFPVLWIALWGIWVVAFYLKGRANPGITNRAISWLIKGSILELLIAIPCHVIVRRRGDCCAPAITGIGIYAGLAIMLLAFGPSVVLLYKQRMDAYELHKPKFDEGHGS
jgi:hypothetical protein